MPAQWILQHFQRREGIEARLLDLRDFPMPFFDQAVPPAMSSRLPYEHLTPNLRKCRQTPPKSFWEMRWAALAGQAGREPTSQE